MSDADGAKLACKQAPTNGSFNRGDHELRWFDQMPRGLPWGCLLGGYFLEIEVEPIQARHVTRSREEGEPDTGFTQVADLITKPYGKLLRALRGFV
jgi:hypothetical protein